MKDFDVPIIAAATTKTCPLLSVYQTLSQSHLLCKSQNFCESFGSLFYDCGTMKVFESLFYVVEQWSKNTNKPIKFSSEYKSTCSHVNYYKSMSYYYYYCSY